MPTRLAGTNELLVVPPSRRRRVAVIAPERKLRLSQLVYCDFEYLPYSELEKTVCETSEFLENKELLFALIDSLNDQKITNLGKTASLAARKDIPAVAIVDFGSLGPEMPKQRLSRLIARIRRTFSATVLMDLDFYGRKDASEPTSEKVKASKVVTELTDLILNPESQIFALELKKALLGKKLALACHGSSKSPFRAADATRQALQNARSLHYGSCVARVLGDADFSVKETNCAVALLKEAVGEGRPIVYDIKKDVSCDGVQVLLLLTGLNLSKLPDLRENPLRTLYNMEPESGDEEPLGFELDLPSLD